MCANLAQNVDKNQLATVLGVDPPAVGKSRFRIHTCHWRTIRNTHLPPVLGQSNTVQPTAIPLVPKQGFLGSYQGLKELETLFYPLLIGAIGLIILFDYGS